MEEHTDDIEITEEEMMEAALEAFRLPMRQPGEMTAKMLSERTGMSKALALLRLNTLTDDGYLKLRSMMDDGHRANGYLPAEGHTWLDIIEVINKRWGG